MGQLQDRLTPQSPLTQQRMSQGPGAHAALARPHLPDALALSPLQRLQSAQLQALDSSSECLWVYFKEKREVNICSCFPNFSGGV